MSSEVEEKHEFRKVELYGLDNKKCCICKQTVYKAEEISTMDQIWHQDCFTCGIGAQAIGQSEGCGAKLELGFYQTINKIPYCTSNHKGCYCGEKVSKELLLKYSQTPSPSKVMQQSPYQQYANNHQQQQQSGSGQADNDDEEIPAPAHSTVATDSNENFYQYELNAFDDKSKLASRAQEKYAPKYGADKQCPICSKTVYKAEELIALGHTWHKDCFTCGGHTDNGCKRKLALGSYQVTDGIQYCSACNDRISRNTQSTYSKPYVNTDENRGETIPAPNTTDSYGQSSYSPNNPNNAAARSSLYSNPNRQSFTSGAGGGSNDDFQSFELSDNFGKEKNTKGDKFRNAKDDSTKCPVCSKTVYKAEELQAIGSVWHKQCFTCGGITDQGCKRKLALGAFQTLNKVPFCSACGDRLAKESQTIMAKTSFPIHSSKDSISGGSAEDTFSGPPTTALPSPPVDTFQSFELSDDFGKPGLQNTAANKFRVGNVDTRKCPQCNATVFKAEELVAVGSVWHAPCFTCGGVSNQGQGCKRKLALGSFQIHNKIAYCGACSDRVAREHQMKASLSSRTRSDIQAALTDDQSTDTLTAISTSEISPRAGYFDYDNDRESISSSRPSIADRSTMFQKSSSSSSSSSSSTNGDQSSSDGFPMPEKRPVKAFQVAGSDLNKCPVCTKSVYKTEQLLALKETWHKECFICGGKGDQGCKRKLGMGEYTGDGGQPYCSSCYDRLTKERYGKNTTATTGASGTSGGSASSIVYPSPKPSSSVTFGGLSDNNNSTDNFQSFELSDEFTKPKQPSAADKFRNLGASGTKKCPICTKTVYQAEEMVCLKMSWHKECFTCGGNQGKGCKRRLGHGEAHGKDGMPYCKMCFDKVVKEEIATFGQQSSGSGVSPRAAEPVCEGSDTSDTHNPHAVTTSVTASPTQHSSDPTTDTSTTATTHSLSTNLSQLKMTDSFYKRELEAEVENISIQFDYIDEDGAMSEKAPSRPVSVKVTESIRQHAAEMDRETATAAAAAETESGHTEILRTTATAAATNTTADNGVGSTNANNQIHAPENKQREHVNVHTHTPAPLPSDDSNMTPVAEAAAAQAISRTITSPHHTTITSSDSFETIYNGDIYLGKKLNFVQNFDENGVFCWIGTKEKTVFPYNNPHTTGDVTVKMSSVFKGAECNILARDGSNTPCYTGNDPYSYIEIDLGHKYTMLLNKYTFRHGGSSKSNLMRSWILQGRAGSSVNNDPDHWITLREHTDDQSLPLESKATASWDVDYTPSNMTSEEAMIGFRHFRLTQTGLNSSGNDCLFCGGLELYGVVFRKM